MGKRMSDATMEPSTVASSVSLFSATEAYAGARIPMLRIAPKVPDGRVIGADRLHIKVVVMMRNDGNNGT